MVDVGGGDQRTADLGGEALHRLVDLLLRRDAVALDLEVDVLRAEKTSIKLVQMGASVLVPPVDDRLARAQNQAALHTGHALGALGAGVRDIWASIDCGPPRRVERPLPIKDGQAVAVYATDYAGNIGTRTGQRTRHHRPR